MRFASIVIGAVMALTLVGCGGSEQATGSAAAQAPAKVFKWKLVTTWPKNFPGLGVAPETFADLVNRMSNGRLQVKVYAGNELVPPFEVFDTVSSGTAEMGHGASYYWRGKSQATAFFTAVPFGLTAAEMNGWLYHGDGLALWRELYSPFNLIPFPGGNTGVQMAGWFNREINSVDDIKGLKMRIPGLAGEVWDRVGGIAVSMPGSEIYTSMQTGVIDATEWVSPYNDLALGLHQVAKYYYYPGWQEPGPSLEFIVNQQAWESLPPDLQAIVEAATRYVNQDMHDEYTAGNNRSLQTLVNEHGVQLRRLPDDVLIALKKATDDVLNEMAAEDEFVRRIRDSVDQFRAQAQDYGHISEKAYMDMRENVYAN